jgi:hypothetical protein
MAAHKQMPPYSVRYQFEKALLWILCSPLRVTTAIVLFGASACLMEYLIYLAVTTSSALSALPSAQALANAVILGFFAAFFGLLVLTAARERHHKVQDDLRRIAELNHQVRNALQVIVYGEYSPDTSQRRSAVLAGVEKIEGTLRELFPLVGERTDDRPWEAHNQVRMKGHIRVHERRGQS